jgi:hypothetical protein
MFEVSSHIRSLMTGTVPEKLGSFDYLTRLMVREDFTKFSHRESFKSYKWFTITCVPVDAPKSVLIRGIQTNIQKKVTDFMKAEKGSGLLIFIKLNIRGWTRRSSFICMKSGLDENHNLKWEGHADVRWNKTLIVFSSRSTKTSWV